MRSHGEIFFKTKIICFFFKKRLEFVYAIFFVEKRLVVWKYRLNLLKKCFLFLLKVPELLAIPSKSANCYESLGNT